MVYSTIDSNRIAYDVDGTSIYYKTGYYDSSWDIGVATKLSNALMIELNDENTTVTISSQYTAPALYYINLWMFLPEKCNVTEMFVGGISYVDYSTQAGFSLISLQGSNDTTNGVDGTWETATFPNGNPAVLKPTTVAWRSSVKAVNFSTAYRSYRMIVGNLYSSGGYYSQCRLQTVHLYGEKAIGETPNDLIFYEITDTEITALNDFGDRPEASTVYDSFKLKNVSPDKVATTVSVGITHTDFLLSLSETGPWTASVSIASIAAGAFSDPIYIKNELGQPPLTLGPKAAKCTATVGSWV